MASKETTPKDRAGYVKQAAEAVPAWCESSADPGELVRDILTDLRHYCDMNKVDFHAAVDTSYLHYLAERKDNKEERPPESPLSVIISVLGGVVEPVEIPGGVKLVVRDYDNEPDLDKDSGGVVYGPTE